MTFVWFALGLALLVLGADWLVKGAASLGLKLGIPSLIIGLTIVAFGTSSPELAVSVKAALAGQADLSVGNVVGSNIFNVLFILGVSALIIPLAVSRQLIRIDVPVMIGVSLLAWWLSFGGITRIEGIVLLVGLAAYVGLQIILARGHKEELEEVTSHAPKSVPLCIGLIIIGLGLLALGSDWLVYAAIAMAKSLGVSELVIGLTIVAAGTSLPEVATSITAAIKGQRDIAVGNVIGSNIFNILGVLGLAAVVSPSTIGVSEHMLAFDIPIMVIIAAICLPIFFTHRIVTRLEGALFFVAWVLYTGVLIVQNSKVEALPTTYLVSAVVIGLFSLIVLIESFRKHPFVAPREEVPETSEA